MEEQIENLMSEHIGVTLPGAAIVVVYEGEMIFSRGYGWADIENQIPIDPATTVFEHASISKIFTYTAAMQLVEQGLLDLNEDITTYLPDSFVFEQVITMRDLMNHTPGFTEALLMPSFDGEQLPTLEDVLLEMQPNQIFIPGTVSAYSNWGSALAGFVVAEISGQDFAVFERENILQPAGMQNTLNLPDWVGNDSFLENRVQGYNSDGEGGFSEATPAYALPYPSGALNGTAEDLALFMKALTPPVGESGPLFASAETLQTLLSPSSLDPINRPATHHGFLTYGGVFPGVGHGGNLPGSSTTFAFVPELRFGYVLLTNVSGEMDLMPAMNDLLLGNAQVPAIGTGLPSAEMVEGRFISARRFEGDFLEFLSYLPMIGGIAQVSALDENRIMFSFGMLGSAVYVQTESYVFHIYDGTEAPMLQTFLPELRFRMEEGRHVQIHSPPMDFTTLPVGRTMPFLIGSLVSVMLSVVFFLIAPMVLFILFLIRRKKQRERTRFDLFSTGFLLSGTLLVFNTLALFILFGINPARSVAEVAPFIWINWGLAGLVVLLFAGSLWQRNTIGEGRKKRKVLFVVTTVMAVLFISQLWNWNFFVML